MQKPLTEDTSKASKATEHVLDEFRAWQKRPLEAVYPVVYLDAIFVGVRDGAHVKKRAFYVALGMGLDGKRDVLGLWVDEAEGAKFWLEIFTELKNRGVNDILFLCADGLTGLDRAIEAAFPQSVHQTCIVHLIRAAMRFVSWADRKALAAALKPLYTAENEAAAAEALVELEAAWGAKCPAAIAPGNNAGRCSSCSSWHSRTPRFTGRHRYTVGSVGASGLRCGTGSGKRCCRVALGFRRSLQRAGHRCPRSGPNHAGQPNSGRRLGRLDRTPVPRLACCIT